MAGTLNHTIRDARISSASLLQMASNPALWPPGTTSFGNTAGCRLASLITTPVGHLQTKALIGEDVSVLATPRLLSPMSRAAAQSTMQTKILGAHPQLASKDSF